MSKRVCENVVSPVLSEYVEGSAGGGMSRRVFLKRSGGATAGTFLAWKGLSNQLKADACACESGSGSGSGGCACEPAPTSLLNDLYLDAMSAFDSAEHDDLLTAALTSTLGFGPLTLDNIDQEPYNGDVDEFFKDLSKNYFEGLGDYMKDEIPFDDYADDFLGKFTDKRLEDFEKIGIGAGILYSGYKLYNSASHGGLYDVPSQIEELLQWEHTIDGMLGGSNITGKIEWGLKDLQLGFNIDPDDNEHAPLFRLGDVDFHGMLFFQLRCEW